MILADHFLDRVEQLRADHVQAREVRARLDRLFDPYTHRPAGEFEELLSILEAAEREMRARKTVYSAKVSLEMRLEEAARTQGLKLE